MTRFTWNELVLAGAMLVAVGAATFTSGCGGTTSVGDDGGSERADASVGDGNGTNDGGLKDSTATEGAVNDARDNDASGVTDGRGDDGNANDASSYDGSGGACTIPEGGGPNDPGHIPCGTSTCNAPAEWCCLGFTSGTCQQGPASPAQQCNTRVIECKQSADCPNGQVCCWGYWPTSGAVSVCASQCSSIGAQLCRCNEDCKNDGPCMPMDCSSGIPVGACGSTAMAGCL